jgi:hypothetical protein
MTTRPPPAAAIWLLHHLGPRYRRDSLAGDLFEEYQQGRSRLWFWQQTFAAVVTGRVRRVLTEAATMAGVIVRWLVALLITTLGVGTITWAGTSDVPRAAHACACHEAQRVAQ